MAFVVKDSLFLEHYFHLWEILIGAITFFKSDEVDSSFEICIGDQKLDKLENLLNSQFIRAVFPNARICKRRSITAKSIVVADRRGRKHGRLNKMLEFDQSRVMEFDAAGMLRQQVLENLGIRPQRDGRRALMVVRKPPRKFSDGASAKVQGLLEVLGFEVEHVDFAAMSFVDQVKAAAEATVIAGVHGNGLTHAAFAEPGTLLVEFFPPGNRHYDYQLLAEFSEHHYIGVREDRVWLSGDRSEPAFGSPGKPVSKLPIEWESEVRTICKSLAIPRDPHVIKKLFRPDQSVTNSPQPFEAELSKAVSHLSGSPLRVKVVDTPMRKPLIFKSIRTADGFTLSIDLKKLEPKWHNQFKHRVPPVLALLRSSDCTARQTIVVFGDYCLSDEVSIGFCAKAGSNHILIPDYDFLESRGFEKLRHWAQANPVPWKTRVDEILWRGVTTGNTQDGENLINQLPRVKMCLLAKNIPRTDFKIVELVQSSSPETDQKVLDEAGIMAEKRLPVEGWGGHKFAIDIDGNTNSFNTMLHRLILGCCVLKVKSQESWCQWFYGEMSPWIHFVPVKSDLSDLAEIIAWCRDHDYECRKIAERGRMFANGLDFHSECKSAVERINSAFAGLTGPT